MNNALNTAIDSLNGAKNALQISGAISNYLTGLGFSDFIFADLSIGGDSSKALAMSARANQLYTHYCQREFYKFDPVMLEVKRKWLPVDWSAKQAWARSTSEMEKMIFEDTIEHGFTHGISVGVRGPFGQLKCFVALTSLEETEFRRWKDFWKNDLFIFAAHIGAISITHFESNDFPKLTPRELECLQWTAHGKTAWEVGKILNLSERTANFHLQNACEKFNVNSKHQATRLAEKLELIGA